MTTLRPDRDHGHGGVRPPLLRPDFALARRADRERAWRGVRVTFVDVVGEGFGIPASHRRVRVGVSLGGLTPADVAVHLTDGRTRCADAVGTDARTVRLASVRHQANGVVVFEGTVPQRVLQGPARLVAMVEPRRRPDEPASDAALVPGVRRLVVPVLDAPASDGPRGG